MTNPYEAAPVTVDSERFIHKIESQKKLVTFGINGLVPIIIPIIEKNDLCKIDYLIENSGGKRDIYWSDVYNSKFSNPFGVARWNY